MKFEDIVLNYQGFNPSELVDSHLNLIVRAIYEKAPYGSSLKAHFSQSEDMFKGVIKITSKAGSFFATTTGPVLNDVSQKLFQQIRQRLDKWKTNRFTVLNGSC